MSNTNNADGVRGMCYGYIRVSTNDQADNGKSLVAQEDRVVQEFEKKWKSQGYSSLRIFREEGVSAYKKNLNIRPQGAILLSKIRANDLVVFTRMDRAFRSTVDGLETLNYIRKIGARVIIMDYNDQEIDTSNPTGLLLMTMILSVAAFESGIKAQRMSEIFAHKQKTQGWTSACRCGFKTVRTNQGIKMLPDQKLLDECVMLGNSILLVGREETIELMKAGAVLKTNVRGKISKGIIVGWDGETKARTLRSAWRKIVTSLCNNEMFEKFCTERGFDPRGFVGRDGKNALRYGPIGCSCVLMLSLTGKNHVERFHSKRSGPIPERDRGVGVPLRPRRQANAVVVVRQDHLQGEPVPCVADPSEVGEAEVREYRFDG